MNHNLGLMFFFQCQIAQTFVVQDEFTQKTQDLNPECKEGSTPIMQLGIRLALWLLYGHTSL